MDFTKILKRFYNLFMRHRGIARIYLYPTIFIVAVIGLAIFRVIAWQWGADRNRSVPPSTTPVLDPAEPRTNTEKLRFLPKPV
ncbi:MAG: hypothetical protein KatS3mg104_0433 [Phycisphaerae bacterium]|jgi:hypothetical protein|nr:MAG: hypothetical protein KatS3mg104_0433 [Phycisphaerae bacterium]